MGSVNSIFLDAALHYAQKGYAVFPIVPRDKNPLNPHGVLEATTNEEQIEAWWQKWPKANVGMSTQGLCVIDVDDPKSPWPDSLERSNEISSFPMQSTPGGGWHRVMAIPAGLDWRNSTKKFAPEIDIRANGGYILVEPSIGENGKPYVWRVELDDRTSLPEATAWIVQQMEALKELVRANGTSGFLGTRTIPDGEQNTTLFQIGSWMRLHGFEERTILATLLSESESRCVDAAGRPWPHPPERVKKIAASVMKYTPDPIRVAAMEDPPPEAAPNEFPDPGPFPMDLVDETPGLMRSVMEYTLSTSPRPQPVFALAGAVSLMSTLTGHKICDQQNLRSNVMSLMVGRSGSGKNRPRQVNRELLSRAGADDLIGSEEIQSGNGVYTIARTKPSCLLQLDELGKMLVRIKESKSDALANVTSTLMKLYSDSGGPCILGGYVDPKRNFVLDQPHCVVLGTTVLESLARSLSSEQLDDGFLSRNLIFHSEAMPGLSDAEIRDIPPDLIEKVRAWHQYQPVQGNLATVNPSPLPIRYTPAAMEAILAYRAGWTPLEKVHPLWTRAEEKAKKLAQDYQASTDGPPPAMRLIDAPAIIWGSRMVDHMSKKLLWLAREWVSDTPLEQQTKRILRWFRAKARPVTMNDFTRANQALPKKTRAEILETLTHSGQLVVEKKGKRTTISFRELD